MPLNDLFTYKIQDSEIGTLKASITIDQNHRLYNGHFPNKPITPGVALIEIVRIVLSDFIAKNLMLTQAKDIKFIASVVPPEMNDLDLSIEYSEVSEGISVNGILSGNDKVYMKIRGIFSESN